MIRIGLLSDSHGYLDNDLLSALSEVDEIWHAGDIGNPSISDNFSSLKKYRAVYGNIDGHELRLMHPKDLRFELEGIKVFMTHIGGYPGRYNQRIREILVQEKPDLYICGHSHILKVMPDKNLGLLHINPGACGHHGFHIMRTLVRFTIDDGKIKDLEVVELGRRGKLS